MVTVTALSTVDEWECLPRRRPSPYWRKRHKCIEREGFCTGFCNKPLYFQGGEPTAPKERFFLGLEG